VQPGFTVHSIEPKRPKHQRVETANMIVKRLTRLYACGDDCMELQAMIYSHIAHDKLMLQGSTPKAILLGDTLISQVWLVRTAFVLELTEGARQ
jgi:hypothetical protein